MPSHISHALLVEDLLGAAGGEIGFDTKNPPESTIAHITADPRARSIAVLGAQGPDLFLHNHRRKPRGFRYGALLHRHGNADLLDSLALSAAREDSEAATATVAYSIGYITHIHLDRVCHPYINWSAGWRGTPDRDMDRPAMHPFLERCIDSVFLLQQRGQRVPEFDFYGRLPERRVDLFALRRNIVVALQTALRSAPDDSRIERRIANAFADAYGFYRNTNAPTDDYFREARARERRGIVHHRWLSLVHPPAELVSVDVLNLNRRTWAHPCDESRRSDWSFLELYREALTRSVATVRLFLARVHEPELPASGKALAASVGPWNLNDGITDDPPCRRTYCDPLPLLELYHEIKSFYDHQ